MGLRSTGGIFPSVESFLIRMTHQRSTPLPKPPQNDDVSFKDWNMILIEATLTPGRCNWVVLTLWLENRACGWPAGGRRGAWWAFQEKSHKSVSPERSKEQTSSFVRSSNKGQRPGKHFVNFQTEVWVNVNSDPDGASTGIIMYRHVLWLTDFWTSLPCGERVWRKPHRGAPWTPPSVH